MKRTASNSSEILSAIAQNDQITKKKERYNKKQKKKLPVRNSSEILSAISQNEQRNEQDEIRYNSEIMSAIAKRQHQKNRKEE